jgi:glycerol transport system ATP-binding protein
MYDGAVVQVGTPVELFNRPNHTFVGYFIGSPGMNVLPCELDQGRPVFHGHLLDTRHPASGDLGGKLEIGVRPEFVHFADHGIPVQIEKVEDLGRYQVVTAMHESDTIKMVVGEDEQVPAENPQIAFDPDYTRIYHDDWVVGGQAP